MLTDFLTLVTFNCLISHHNCDFYIGWAASTDGEIAGHCVYIFLDDYSRAIKHLLHMYGTDCPAQKSYQIVTYIFALKGRRNDYLSTK